MSDIFISYSRRDKDFVRALHAQLTAEEHDVWVDWEDIPATADWWQEIQSAIEEAHLFAFVISPQSVLSDICRKEINYALENNKRFIPILLHELDDVNASHVHEAVRSHNWIDFSSGTVEEDSLRLLVKSFTMDPDYVRKHTRLLVRAREWQDSGRQVSYLIEGAELTEFQQWLKESHTRTPKPTELQYDFILASQTRRTRVQMRIAAGLILGIMVVGILSILAIIQNQRLETEAAERVALENALATGAAERTLSAQQAQTNQANVIDAAYSRNTQQAISLQVTRLIETVAAFETQVVITPESQPTATATASLTATGTLPPTWTPTTDVQPTVNDSETTEGASAQSVSTATVDPAVIATATAQSDIYATATQQAMITPSPTLTATVTTFPTSTNTPAPTARPTLDVPPPLDLDNRTVTYIVQSGDIAIDIADRFGVTVSDIAAVNDLTNLSRIFVGQELLIPYRRELSGDESLFVSANAGTDSPNCGTESAPCATINGALQVAESFVQIRIASGVYQEQLRIEDNVVLIGNGIENTVLTGDFSGTVVSINQDVNVTIAGMTITGGSGQIAGGILNYGELNLREVRISNNVADLAGGGLVNGGILIADFVDFESNFAPFYDDVYTAPDAGFIVTENMRYERETFFDDIPPLPQDEARFMIGEIVLITTTDGDTLRLRERANINSNIVESFNPGTPLLIVGAPQRNNGFRWWGVQTATDLRGWVADFADGEPTILPLDEVNRPRGNSN